MRLIAVGRQKPGPEAELFARYNARMRPRLAVTEVADGRGAPAEVARREGEALLAALCRDDFPVVLDQDGPMLTSEALARQLRGWTDAGFSPAFLIGGAGGLSAQVVAHARATLSLGRLTWPHMLVRVMLAEQLYRAQSIDAGHPYHRPGRPGVG